MVDRADTRKCTPVSCPDTPVVLLVSVPRSGVTWLHRLLEAASPALAAEGEGCGNWTREPRRDCATARATLLRSHFPFYNLCGGPRAAVLVRRRRAPCVVRPGARARRPSRRLPAVLPKRPVETQLTTASVFLTKWAYFHAYWEAFAAAPRRAARRAALRGCGARPRRGRVRRRRGVRPRWLRPDAAEPRSRRGPRARPRRGASTGTRRLASAMRRAGALVARVGYPARADDASDRDRSTATVEEALATATIGDAATPAETRRTCTPPTSSRRIVNRATAAGGCTS